MNTILAVLLCLIPNKAAADDFDFDDEFGYPMDDQWVGHAALNWGGTMGAEFPYKRFSIGVDGGAGYRLGPQTPLFLGLSGGFHTLKPAKYVYEGNFVSAGLMFGLSNLANVFVNAHWAGTYEFADEKWTTGPHLGVNLGTGLFLHAGFFMPKNTADSWVLTARIGIGA